MNRNILRITPAYAGKTQIHCIYSGVDEDHPRLRGKDILACLLNSTPTGSPPLTRERRKDGGKRYATEGITPAYAGKTCPAF